MATKKMFKYNTYEHYSTIITWPIHKKRPAILVSEKGNKLHKESYIHTYRVIAALYKMDS